MSLLDTARVKSLAMEGILTTVRANHIIDAFVIDISGTSITFKIGVLFSFIVVCTDLPFENPTHLVAGVSSSHDDTERS